jgi:hypothetical protein
MKLNAKKAVELTRIDITALTLEQLQRHRVKLVSALYEARGDFGIVQAVKDGYMLPVASESASGFVPKYLYLNINLGFALDCTVALEKKYCRTIIRTDEP